MTRLAALVVFASLSVLLVSGPVGASEEEVTVKLKDLRYGLYSTRSRSLVGSHITKRYRGRNIRTVTQIVPMKAGVTFGLQMRVEASRGKELQLLVLVEHPSITRETPVAIPSVVSRSSSRLRWSSENLTAWTRNLRNKSLFSIRYILDNDWEMVPGGWTISVHLIGIDEPIQPSATDVLEHSKGMMLYKQSFCVVPPGEELSCEGVG